MQITQQENVRHRDLKRSKGEKDFNENTVTYINNTNGKILSGLVKVSQRKLGGKTFEWFFPFPFFVIIIFCL